VTDTRVVCASHSPLMYCAASEPLAGAEIDAAFEARAAEVADFKPDVIFAFGPDHYTSLFQSMAPVFCIGTRCEAIGDIGGFAGRLNVPTDLAMECIASVHTAGVDVAISHDLKIDHGISQTLHRVASGLDAYPTIPVLINVMTHPLPPFRRSRALGEAIGAFVKAKGLRALFIGSGGLSHNPEPIFPPIGE
jgi:2,3-dihydroxyphenylpropionate 1,2-dioxygenase